MEVEPVVEVDPDQSEFLADVEALLPEEVEVAGNAEDYWVPKKFAWTVVAALADETEVEVGPRIVEVIRAEQLSEVPRVPAGAIEEEPCALRIAKRIAFAIGTRELVPVGTVFDMFVVWEVEVDWEGNLEVESEGVRAKEEAAELC